MSVVDIKKEEERCRHKDESERRALRKRKHEVTASDVALINANEEEDSVGTTGNHKEEKAVVNEMEEKNEGVLEYERSDVDFSEIPQEVVIVGTTNEFVDSVEPRIEANDPTETIAKLQERVAALKKELRGTQQNSQRWKRNCMEKVVTDQIGREEGGVHLVEWASKAVEQLMYSEDQYMCISRQRSEKACKDYRNAIALSIWTNGSTFYEYLRPLLITYVKHHLRETVFHPAKILMQMDLAGGTLSMEGLKVLRRCETDGKKYVRNMIICSSADLKCCCVKVDTLAKHIVPYEHGHLDEANGGGEFIQWEPRHMMAAMINAYQLTEVAKQRPVEIHVAIDGAMISKNWNHLTAGAKQGDNAALCPRRKQLIYGNVDETTVQSRDHCFPYIMAMCRETKKSIEWMRP